jgi:hypothetical protein
VKDVDAVNILGLTYAIESSLCISKDEYLLGRIDFIEQRIQIDAGLSDEKRRVVLLHEIIHGILEANGFAEENQNEHLIQSLATALVQVFAGNGELLRFLFSSPNDERKGDTTK